MEYIIFTKLPFGIAHVVKGNLKNKILQYVVYTKVTWKMSTLDWASNY